MRQPQPFSLVFTSAFSLTLAVAGVSAVRADVKIVSKVTTTGAGGGGGFGGFRRGGNQGGGQAAPQAATPSPAQVYTTYFKGRKARRESADGSSVVIYDRDADKIYTLDPKAKTYYSTDYKTVLGEDITPANSPIQQTTKISLREPAAGAASTTVSGIASRDFTVDGLQTMTFNAAAFGGRGGANAQAGGNGAGQGGGRRGGFGGFSGLSTAVTGSISLANPAAVLPTEISGGAYDRTLILPLAEQLLPAGNQMFKPLMASIARQQSVPVGAKITMQRTIQTTPPADNAGGDTPAAPPAIPPTVVTMEVQSIDKTATLDSALFTVPTDFTMVDAPQPRGFGRGGGYGGQGGQGGGGRQRRQRNGAGAPANGANASANQNPAAL